LIVKNIVNSISQKGDLIFDPFSFEGNKRFIRYSIEDEGRKTFSLQDLTEVDNILEEFKEGMSVINTDINYYKNLKDIISFYTSHE